MSLNMLMWLTMLTFFAAILFFAAAAWLALAIALGPALAALLTGAGLIVVVGLLALLIWLATKPPAEKPDDSRAEDNAEHVDGNADLDRAARLLEDHYGMVLAGTVIAGAAFASSPGLRKVATRTAGPVLTRAAMRMLRKHLG